MKEPKGQPTLDHPYRSHTFALMAIDDIESGRRPGYAYLRRYRLIQTPWFAVYVHQIWEDDTQWGGEPFPHNHPANFRIFILKGGYEEVVWEHPNPDGPTLTIPGEAKSWCAGDYRKMGTTEAHYIRRLFRVPTWSLVFVGKKNPKSWGFYTDEGWVHFQKFYEEHKGYIP